MAEMAGQQEFTSTLGADAHFKGTLIFEKSLRVLGRLEGSVATPGRLHVAKEGKVEADVEAASVVVEGDVQGTVVATDRVELKATAHLEGDLRAPRLAIEAGAVFSGHVSIGPDAAKERPPQRQRPANASPKPEPVGAR